MLMPSPAARVQRGFTILELMIVISIMGILLMIGLPNMSKMIQNGQIRTAAESTLAGIQTARNEAIRRNATVRFQLTSTLTSACTLSSSGTNWVVSLATPAGSCDSATIDPSNTAPANPAIIQKRSGAEGTPKATLAGTTGGSTAASTIVFNGIGRVSGSGNIDTINIAHTTDTCEHTSSSGTIRCLRILVSTGGTIKMCDPKVTDTTDPRYCAL